MQSMEKKNIVNYKMLVVASELAADDSYFIQRGHFKPGSSRYMQSLTLIFLSEYCSISYMVSSIYLGVFSADVCVCIDWMLCVCVCAHLSIS